MSNLRKNDDGTYTVMVGSNFDNVILEAQQIAPPTTEEVRDVVASDGLMETDETRKDSVVTFDFNGVTVNVDPLSDLALIRRDWERAMSGYLGDNAVVGPHPKAELSSEELAKDAEIEAANKARRDAEAAKYQAETKAKHDRVTTRMANAPEMEFADEESKILWQSWVDANTDRLGAGVISYAKRWAQMMQLEMSEGKSLTEIYDTTRVEADLEGMSGASGGFAEQMLVQAWKYGAELKTAREEWRRTITSRFSGS